MANMLFTLRSRKDRRKFRFLQPAKEVGGKVIFSQMSVCSQGVGVSLTETPLDRDPWTDTPLDRDPPYGKKRAVRIQLECILVCDCSRSV